MAQYSSNSGRETINKAKIGLILFAVIALGLASLFSPIFFPMFIGVLFVIVLCALIIILMKYSKTARKLNYTDSLVTNYRQYGAGDWHTIQSVRMMVIDYYRNNKQDVPYLEIINDWGNHYTGQITIDGVTSTISIIADGSGNLNWDIDNMPLINCPECGQQMSSHARICPHCGYSFITNISNIPSSHKNKRWITIGSFGLIILIVGVVSIFFINKDQSPAQVKTEVAKENETIKEEYAPINVLSFCLYDSEEEVMDIKKVSQLSQSLEELKFQKTSETESEIDFATDDSYTDFRKIRRCTYERGDGQDYIKVKIEGIDDEYDIVRNGYLEITFSDKTLLKTFLSDAESNHFTKISSTSYHSPNYDEIYWTGADIEIDGNTIILRKRYHGD